jgi:hypothetical protein
MKDAEQTPHPETRWWYPAAKDKTGQGGTMTKRTTIALAAALVLALASFSYAKYVSGYKVVEVAGQQVTIQKDNEEPVIVQVGKGKFKAGEAITFDADKKKIKKEYAGGC